MQRVLGSDGAATIVYRPVADATEYWVRFIASDAADKADDNWFLVQAATSYEVGDDVYGVQFGGWADNGAGDWVWLANGTRYDVQMQSGDGVDYGPWTSTMTVTPAEPGSNQASALALPTDGVELYGWIFDSADTDFFSVTLTERSWLTVTTFSDSPDSVDPVAELQDSTGTIVRTSGDRSATNDNVRFELVLDAGAYYVKVDGETGNPSGGFFINAVASAASADVHAIAAVGSGDESLTVLFEQLGEELAYEARIVPSDSAAKLDDANWRVFQADETFRGRFGSNRLMFVDRTGYYNNRGRFVDTGGLTNGTRYDVQVRGWSGGVPVTAWSATATGTPLEPGSTNDTAATIRSDVTVDHDIDLGETDRFTFTLAEERSVVIQSCCGQTDVDAVLYDSTGAEIDSDADGGSGRHFLLVETLEAGTYYLDVNEYGDDHSGGFGLHYWAVRDTESAGDADTFQEGRFSTFGEALGVFTERYDDDDYFRLDVPADGDYAIYARSDGADTRATLLAENGDELLDSDHGWFPSQPEWFLVRRELTAGTYYLKVDGDTGTRGPVPSCRREEPAPYELFALRLTEPGNTIATAEEVSLSLPAGGNIASATEKDYLRFSLDGERSVIILGWGGSADLDGVLVNGADEPVTVTRHQEQKFTACRYQDSEGMLSACDIDPEGFVIVATLSAGDHYLRLTADQATAYTVHLETDSQASVIADCSARSSSREDSLFGCQWQLENGDAGVWDIDVGPAWASGRFGENVPVVVVDDGLDPAHPDLVDNVDAARNHDYAGNGQVLSPLEDHGVAVGGVIASRDNSIGGRGVAPRAKIWSHNFLTASTDVNRVDAMTRGAATTAVSNNSWGFRDRPGLSAVGASWEMAVETGVETGNGGKGVVYVWAAGNGGNDGDQSNHDEMNNFHAVTAVCATLQNGVRSSYSERGANLWVCAPVDDVRTNGRRNLTTTNYSRYQFLGGTSAAAPQVSGVVALLRGAYPNLTWRDVKLILAASASENDPGNSGWSSGALKYGADSDRYRFNHEYGFGLVNAGAALDLAAAWTLLPAFVEADAVEQASAVTVADGGAASSTLEVHAGGPIEFVEYVEVNTDFTADAFLDLKLELESPAGAVSVLSLPYDDPCGDRYGLHEPFRFGSSRHLGEDPAGTWKLRIADEVTGGAAATLNSWNLVLYGHRSRPAAPAVSSVDPLRRSLAVAWTEPAWPGASTVTSYDLRHIRSDAPDKTDGNWSERTEAWTTGPLSYTLTGLPDGTAYDVQVRAVNDRGSSPWSATMSASTLRNRAPVAVGSLVGPDLRVGDPDRVVDVAGAFEDPDTDALTYDASSSAPGVAGASASGAQVTLVPVARGTATITVTATDIAGSNSPATQTFGVRVKGRRGVTISRDALTIAEGATATYTVVLDAEPTGPVVVTPSVAGSMKITVAPASLTFAAGDWDAPRAVTVEAVQDADAVSDPPVTILHEVGGGDYGAVRAAPLEVTVVEDDSPTLSVEPVRALESAGSMTFEVTLSVPSSDEVAVDYETSDGTGTGAARSPSDYTAAAGTLTFPATTVARRIVLDIVDDTEDEEEEETFRLRLRNARHASLAGGGSTLEVPGTIRDDDDPEVEVSFGSPTYGVTEGGTADVAVRLDKDPERALEIFLESAHHGGATIADYSGVPRSVTFGPGVRRQEFLVAATDDIIDDDGEAVVLSFVSLPPRVTGDGRTTIAIADNDGGGGAGGPPSGGGGGVGGGGGPPSGGGPPPGEAEDDGGDGDGGDGGGVPGGGGTGGGGGPPRAAIATDAECEGTFCRVRAGARLSFRDASGGAVRSRLWDFGDGRRPRGASVSHAWSTPGFYDVTLTVSDGAVASIASLTFLVEAASPAGTCVADDRTRCLRDSRYAVTVDWWNAAAAGVGTVVHAGTDDSGMFQFFGASNWEVLVKVLDGCALNGHAWVFGASTTDLGYVIRVRDTATGAVKEYRNEPGVQAPAITDVTAFPASCAR